MSDSRLFKILYYLIDKEHATAPELAAEFEVSPRTIYRDIDVLSSAGIPIYAEQGRNGGIYLLHDFILDKALLSENERQEILAAIQSISVTGYVSGKEMMTKLSALFNVNTGNWLEVDFTHWGKSTLDHSKFERLKMAVIQHKEIEIIYESACSERSKRIVQPLKLSYKSKEWYLKAFCLKRQDFRMFKLNRILKLEILEQTFTPRPYPEPEDNPQRQCERVILLFSKKIAYRVYDEFEETQIAYRENGDLIVSTEMPVDAWLIGYLLSFGTQVEIVKPQYLRGMLAAQAQEIYRKNSTDASTEGRNIMGRPTSKAGLMMAATDNYKKLNTLISGLTEKELSTDFDFAEDEKKKEAHWKRDRNLRDVLIHLYEWHQLLLHWVHDNQNGEDKPFIPQPYNWKTYGEMNVEFWKKHQNTSLEEAKEMVEKSHHEVLRLAETFSNEELFTKGVYKWVGGSTLGSYFVSVTASHYDWAMKKLKAHRKNCNKI